MQYNKEAHFSNLNKMIKNKPKKAARITLGIAFIALALLVLPFHDWKMPVQSNWSVVFILLFICISAFVVLFVFRSRGKKLEKLISSETLVAHWKLDDSAKETYANHQFENERSKNKAIFLGITFLMTLVFGLFILFMEKDKLLMFLFLIGIIAIVALFAFGMPYYYRRRNLRGDGNVLIGKNYAYVNGFFHNWDFPLSGLVKVEVIHDPFYGLYLQYYYYDKTLRNVESLNIPANENMDLNTIVELIKQ